MRISTRPSRTIFASIATMVAAFSLLASAQPGDARRRTHLVIVVDGLRPDYVTAAQMPRLTSLAQRGIVFNAHHAVYPTVTRVNAASFVTGAYGDGHGIMGNTVFVPSVSRTRVLDTGNRLNLEAIATAEGRLLTAPSLGEILEQHGKAVLGVGSGTSGAALLLNHAAANGVVIHNEFTRPSSLDAQVRAIVGATPPHALPNDAQNGRAVDGYLKYGLETMRPDVTLMWISDPDTTAHTRGIGADDSRRALTLVDGQIGRIEDTLRAKGLLDRTNIIVTSDHGFSTHTRELKLAALVEPFARKRDDGTSDIVVAEGAIYIDGHDATRIAAIVAMLQKRPEVGAIFTRGGAVAGTLSYDVVRWNHARAGDILVSSNWSDAANDAGYRGATTDSGTAGHGSTSPYDIHNTLIAVGPDFREHATSDAPTGNADIAPTLLHLLGIAIPKTMTGRVIDEGLRGGSAAKVVVSHETKTVKTSDGSYELTAHTSVAADHRYLDSTEVERTPRKD